MTIYGVRFRCKKNRHKRYIYVKIFKWRNKMSVTIRDMLKLPVFNNAKVVAGYDGLDSVIMSVSVLESADEESLGIIFPGVSSV